MASNSYFSNFPIITYANQQAVDITTRLVVNQQPLSSPYDFYAYDITIGARPDQVAYSKFQNPYYDYIIYLTNNIIDPYYDWPLTQENFYQYIQQKYNSIDSAQQKVVYYINNWVGQSNVSVSFYDASPPNIQNYYEPIYNSRNSIVGYTRKQVDWTASTNYILDLGISGNTVGFIENEIVNIVYEPTTNGKAQVVAWSNTDLIVQHIFDDAFPSGNITINSNSYVYGTESGVNATITSCSFLSNTIAADELSYWAPVYYFDMENEQNEKNKTVLMLQNGLVQNFVSTFNTVLTSN